MRSPAVAGTFYPADGQELLRMIEGFLKNAKSPPVRGKLRGLIVPHAGYIYSGIVAAAGYKILKEHKDEYDDIILIGPSHYMTFYGAASVVSDVWETPLGQVVMQPMAGKQIVPLREPHIPEHSLEVQVPFLQVCAPNAKIFPLLMGGSITPEEMANDIYNRLTDRTLVIASSDLSHYHPYAEAVRIDSIANSAIPSLDIQRVKRDVEACGKSAILSVMYLAQHFHWKGVVLDYRNSGDTAGDKDSVVGYGCYGFFEE
ncbi:MAG: AmmeMemoRadiSam system protein B [Candidatus Micrarchaeia archaeon]